MYYVEGSFSDATSSNYNRTKHMCSSDATIQFEIPFTRHQYCHNTVIPELYLAQQYQRYYLSAVTILSWVTECTEI